MSKILEYAIMSKFHIELNNRYKEYRGLCYHIQNESQTLHHSQKIAIGIVQGMPDYHILISNNKYKSLFLEFKTSTGKLSDNQKRQHEILRKNNHCVCLVRSVEEAFVVFDQYVNNNL